MKNTVAKMVVIEYTIYNQSQHHKKSHAFCNFFCLSSYLRCHRYTLKYSMWISPKSSYSEKLYCNCLFQPHTPLCRKGGGVSEVSLVCSRESSVTLMTYELNLALLMRYTNLNVGPKSLKFTTWHSDADLQLQLKWIPHLKDWLIVRGFNVLLPFSIVLSLASWGLKGTNHLALPVLLWTQLYSPPCMCVHIHLSLEKELMQCKTEIRKYGYIYTHANTHFWHKNWKMGGYRAFVYV